MTKKRRTLEQLEAARLRAVSMMENFGDSDGAAEFDGMTADEYAEHKGIEVINSNPMMKVRIRNMSLSKKDYTQLSSYINSIVEGALTSNSRTDMRTTLEEVSDLTADDAVLVFSADGTVEIESNEVDEDDEEDD